MIDDDDDDDDDDDGDDDALRKDLHVSMGTLNHTHSFTTHSARNGTVL